MFEGCSRRSPSAAAATMCLPPRCSPRFRRREISAAQRGHLPRAAIPKPSAEADEPISTPKGVRTPGPMTFPPAAAVTSAPSSGARSCPVVAVLLDPQEGRRAYLRPQRARITVPSGHLPANDPLLRDSKTGQQGALLPLSGATFFAQAWAHAPAFISAGRQARSLPGRSGHADKRRRPVPPVVGVLLAMGEEQIADAQRANPCPLGFWLQSATCVRKASRLPTWRSCARTGPTATTGGRARRA